MRSIRLPRALGAALLRARLPLPCPAQGAGDAPRPTQAEQEVESLRARALAAERAGELEAAAEAWLDAGRRMPPGSDRDLVVGRAFDLKARLALRRELASTHRADSEAFAGLAVEAVAEGGVTLRGEPLAWSELPVRVLSRIAAKASISPQAQLGLVLEQLRAEEAEEVEIAERELARMIRRGLYEEAEVFGLIARWRGEAVPEGGYVFLGAEGRWITAAEAAERAHREAVEALVAKLAAAANGDRDGLLAKLREEAGPAEILRALEPRWMAAVETLGRGRILEQLERVADQRRELDAAREDALELIFDEEEYFYPYNPPNPPHKASDYPRVQRRVDELVSAARLIWEVPKGVRLPTSFRRAHEELSWLLSIGGEEPLFALPAELPVWILGLPRELERVELANFAWNALERDELALSRAVRGRNQRLWQEAPRLERELSRPATLDERQVEITNDYRDMLGRPALAWNPRIQAACRGHSDYQANSGNFGHENTHDPARRWPADRMRLEGYDFGAAENCAMGRGDPLSAHVGWCHSSGHHRNLLSAHHREMASANAGGIWTQCFGHGTDFLEDLQP